MADILKSIEITIDVNHEGGYQSNPNDRANWSGGEIGTGELIGTNYGITPADMPGINIKNLTPDVATKWYLTTTKPQRFNNPLYCQILDQQVCDKIFDMGVLFGVETAVTVVQALLEQNVDGGFGPMTLRAVNEADPKSLLEAIKTTFVTHALGIGAAHLQDREFVAGWIRRINS